MHINCMWLWSNEFSRQTLTFSFPVCNRTSSHLASSSSTLFLFFPWKKAVSPLHLKELLAKPCQVKEMERHALQRAK